MNAPLPRDFARLHDGYPPRRVVPFGDRAVLRINLAFVYNHARQLEEIAKIPDENTTLGDIALQMFSVRSCLESMHGGVYGPYLRASYEVYSSLKVSVDDILKDFNFERSISSYQIFILKKAFEEYRIAFLAEVGILHSYFVTQKGGFDTSSLLLWGENFFPADLGAKVGEALFDARESAKCMAFELPTACGFHVFRALEAVLRRYYTHVTGGAPVPKVRNIGVYLNALKMAGKGSPKILGSIKQVADLHRNPLIHPEAVFSMEDAAGAMGIARSVIAAMLVELPVLPSTTTNQVASS